jgi:hypothetical protein
MRTMIVATLLMGALVFTTSTRPPYLAAGAEAQAGGFAQHCVQNPDNNCSNKKFYCEVTRENLENPSSDTSDGHGNRICCWSHYHP